MRIAIVSEHASPLAVLGGVDAGGQNVHVAALATELARQGHEVTVYTRREDASVARHVELARGVVVEHVDAGPPEPISKDVLLPFMEEFADELEWAWRLDRPDVVHSHFWMSGRAALAAAEPLELPVVHTFHALAIVRRRHQGRKDTSPPEWLDEERRIIERADLLVAQCSEEVFELVRLGADRSRIAVAPSGVDLELFTPDGPVEPGDGRPRVLVVARLVERKGIGNVITALARLEDAELVVAGGPPRERLGDDPNARRLLALARRHGVADRVDFRGGVDRRALPPLMRSADAVVCAPWYEPFGIVPLEAMACGVPVVASAVGGLIDTVVHRKTGLHVAPRSPAAIAGALSELLADEELRRSLGAAGARRARSRYSWAQSASVLVEAYASVLERRAVTAATEARR